MDYKIEFINITDLKMYDKNTKKHNEKQVEQIAKSIEKFGFRQNLVVDKDNVIVIGHGRYLAAKKLGIPVVPCVKADNLTEEQIKALRIADNKLNESEWDLDMLNLELDDILDIDMSDFGFDLPSENEQLDENFKAQTLSSGEELDINDFSNDKFECTCPKCGFMFNRKDKA